MFLIILGIG